MDKDAYDEMIDALVNSYKMLHSLLDDKHTQELCNMRDLVCEKLENDETLKQIKAALEKGGCTFDLDTHKNIEPKQTEGKE